MRLRDDLELLGSAFLRSIYKTFQERSVHHREMTPQLKAEWNGVWRLIQVQLESGIDESLKMAERDRQASISREDLLRESWEALAAKNSSLQVHFGGMVNGSCDRSEPIELAHWITDIVDSLTSTEDLLESFERMGRGLASLGVHIHENENGEVEFAAMLTAAITREMPERYRTQMVEDVWTSFCQDIADGCILGAAALEKEEEHERWSTVQSLIESSWTAVGQDMLILSEPLAVRAVKHETLARLLLDGRDPEMLCLRLVQMFDSAVQCFSNRRDGTYAEDQSPQRFDAMLRTVGALHAHNKVPSEAFELVGSLLVDALRVDVCELRGLPWTSAHSEAWRSFTDRVNVHMRAGAEASLSP